MNEPKVRELRVTDIRCACGAGPGQRCARVLVDGAARRWVEVEGGGAMVHPGRFEEFSLLIADDWQWQEVDPTDRGARKE